METPFLEIPEERFDLPKSWEDEIALEIFDTSYLLGLTEDAKKQTGAEKYIVFKLGDKTFAVLLQNVVEVCRCLAVTSLPNVPRWLAGIANLRGDLLAVIDPNAFGAGEASNTSKSKMIVLADRQKKLCVGLLVDQILEIALLPAEHIDSLESGGAGGLAYFVCGRSQYRNSSLLMLDVKKLLSSPKLRKLNEH
jgi:chemotaxis signal transduction protein